MGKMHLSTNCGPIQVGDKYEILRDHDAKDMWERPIEKSGKTLYRIRAIRDIVDPVTGLIVVTNGSLGGYIASSKCLSKEGSCWIYPNCFAFKHTVISDDAVVKGNVELRGQTTVSEYARLEGCIIAGDSNFKFHSKVSGHLMLQECAARGYSEITGEGCALSLVADSSEKIHIEGYYHSGSTCKETA